MLSHYLIKTITDLESIIGDWKAGLLKEENFKAELRVLANRLSLEEEMEGRAREDIINELETEDERFARRADEDALRVKNEM